MFPLVYADFQNTDAAGRIRLNTAGTAEDLARHRLSLTDGLRLTLYTDDAGEADGLWLDGTVVRATGGEGWVAVVDWAAIIRTVTAVNRPQDLGKAI